MTVKHEQVLEMLNRYGSISYAYDAAAKHAESARTAICSFPDSEIKRALLSIPDFVVERSS
jgi:octaprenyl-diphosphate synthase